MKPFPWGVFLVTSAMHVSLAHSQQTPAAPAATAPPTSAAAAQQPPPYGMPISLEQAKKVMDAAEAEARKNGWPVAIAIVDSAAQLQQLAGLVLSSTEGWDEEVHNAQPALSSAFEAIHQFDCAASWGSSVRQRPRLGAHNIREPGD